MSDLKDAIRYAIFEKITSPDSEIVDTVLYIRRAIKERNHIVPDFESREKFSVGLIVPISLPPNCQPGHCFDVVQEIERQFNHLGGGSTNFDTRGAWVDDNETLVRDKSIMITTEMLLKDWHIAIDVLRFLIRNEIQLKLKQKCVFLYVDNQTFGDAINLLGETVNDFPNQDVFGDVDPKCKQYLQQSDSANQSTSVNQTATGSGNIQISTSDGANITIHSQPEHDGLTINQLWQGTRDEMQRNAEEKVRIKKDLEDSMNQLRAENKQYQKQIEALQDELDELTSKLIDSGGNGGSPNQPMVSGETIITNILDVLEPNIRKKYNGFSTDLSFLQMIPIFQEELYLSMLENRSLIDIEIYSRMIILTHISGRRFVFRILGYIGGEDERKRNLDIVRGLEHELPRDYKLTDDRFCKARSCIFSYDVRLLSGRSRRSWFVFGTEIIKDAS
jgi:hypothetical protein